MSENKNNDGQKKVGMSQAILDVGGASLKELRDYINAQLDKLPSLEQVVDTAGKVKDTVAGAIPTWEGVKKTAGKARNAMSFQKAEDGTIPFFRDDLNYVDMVVKNKDALFFITMLSTAVCSIAGYVGSEMEIMSMKNSAFLPLAGMFGPSALMAGGKLAKYLGQQTYDAVLAKVNQITARANEPLNKSAVNIDEPER